MLKKPNFLHILVIKKRLKLKPNFIKLIIKKFIYENNGELNLC